MIHQLHAECHLFLRNITAASSRGPYIIIIIILLLYVKPKGFFVINTFVLAIYSSFLYTGTQTAVLLLWYTYVGSSSAAVMIRSTKYYSQYTWRLQRATSYWHYDCCCSSTLHRYKLQTCQRGVISYCCCCARSCMLRFLPTMYYQVVPACLLAVVAVLVIYMYVICRHVVLRIPVVYRTKHTPTILFKLIQ